MKPRLAVMALWLLLCVSSVLADDSPPGLVETDNDQDLLASESAPNAQKREATLSNSYGEPLPPDAYGPPKDLNNIGPGLPAPVYGVPDLSLNSIVFPSNIPPPGAYGPPAPINFPIYEGPPPPIKPKPHYGPPKPVYGPPKPIYGPPKKSYGPPKQSLPKPSYGAPFKSYGPPKSLKPIYGVPKPIYGPPKATYGPPIPDLPPIALPQNFAQLPAPIYGTPLNNLPLNLKPNFPLPVDTYGPPGHQLGAVGHHEQQIVLQDFGNHLSGHYGPPQPDPNPRPPHPGIPAPPTPPHVLYDGWKPIPGVSQPFGDHHQHHIEHHQQQQHHHQHHDSNQHHQHHQHQHVEQHFEQNQDQYGPPPPIHQGHHHGLGGHSLPNVAQPPPFSGAQISSGYSHVHQDALSNIDLNAIVGGDSNHIDQSKTVFEAHYTELAGNQNSQDVIVHTSVSAPEGPSDSYGAPPSDSFSTSGPYPASIRQHGAKGLNPPSGIYGVPPGSQYGAPPRPPPANLPLPYGTLSGSNGGHSIHSGAPSPRHPIKFRESVPEGLFQQIGATTNHKDAFGVDHVSSGPKYIPPPIREVKDINQHTGNHGMSLSIEPTNLYSLPLAGNAINFNQNLQQPNNLYGSPIDSYSVPLHTVSDHTGSASISNAVTATLDGLILGNISNLDAAAILKHCPYHEAILRAAKLGEKIPSDLASSYVASLSSLGNVLNKNTHYSISNDNSVKELASASQTIVQTVVPAKSLKGEKFDKNSLQKGKSLKQESSKQSAYKDDERYSAVSNQILRTSEKIKNLSEEAKQLQQKIVKTNQNINQVNGQILQGGTQFGNREIPVKGQHGTYTLQIQSADDATGGKGKHSQPSIPHEQLLSEGLLQSILQAIEQPSRGQLPPKPTPSQNIHFQQSHVMDLSNLGIGGLDLPAGYEPIDRTKVDIRSKPTTIKSIDQEVQSTNIVKHMLHKESAHRHRGDIPYTECDLKADNSIRHTIVVPAPTVVGNEEKIDEVDDNDVAIYFDESKNEEKEKTNEPVTEISVATSISEEEDERRNAQQYGGKTGKEFGDKLERKL